MNVTKESLVGKIAQQTGLSKAQSLSALDSFLGIVLGALERGDEVRFPGWGSFRTKTRAPRQVPDGREKDGKATFRQIPAKRVVVFKPGKRLSEAVSSNGNGKD